MTEQVNKFIQEATTFYELIQAVGMVNLAGQKRKIHGVVEAEIIDNLVTKIHERIYYPNNIEIIAKTFLSPYGKEKCLNMPNR